MQFFFNIQTGKEKLAEYLKIPAVDAKNIIDSFLGTGFHNIACYIIYLLEKSFYRDVLKISNFSYIIIQINIYNYNSISKEAVQ